MINHKRIGRQIRELRIRRGWKSAYGIMNREKKRTLWRNLIKEIHIDTDYNIKIIFY